MEERTAPRVDPAFVDAIASRLFRYHDRPRKPPGHADLPDAAPKRSMQRIGDFIADAVADAVVERLLKDRMTLAGAAHHLSLPEDSLRRLVAEGKLRPAEMWFDVADLNALPEGVDG